MGEQVGAVGPATHRHEKGTGDALDWRRDGHAVASGQQRSRGPPLAQPGQRQCVGRGSGDRAAALTLPAPARATPQSPCPARSAGCPGGPRYGPAALWGGQGGRGGKHGQRAATTHEMLGSGLRSTAPQPGGAGFPSICRHIISCSRSPVMKSMSSRGVVSCRAAGVAVP